MQLSEARQLALELMEKHNLNGWQLQFNNQKRTHGRCNFRDKVIQLSKPLTLLNSVATVTNTILHEIAHALTPQDGGHGRLWKCMAIAIGATPEVYAGPDTVKVTGKYVAICINCGQVGYRFRKITHNKPMVCVGCKAKGIRSVVTWEQLR